MLFINYSFKVSFELIDLRATGQLLDITKKSQKATTLVVGVSVINERSLI